MKNYFIFTDSGCDIQPAKLSQWGVSLIHLKFRFDDMAKDMTNEEMPIGDFYTMGPKDAVTAARWLKAKVVIPMHYNTFPVISQDVGAFLSELTMRTDSQGVALAPGESFDY